MINVKTKDIIEKDDLFSKFSSYSKVIRGIGWIKRFIYNCKEKKETTNFLTANEYHKAEITLIIMIQNKHFVSLEDHYIRDFLPFIDNNELIRTKSKLLFRDDNFNFRCPVILPSKDYYVDLLIKEKHLKLNHAGATMTLNALREKFWIIKGRKVVREMIQKCVDCRRHHSKPINAHIAPLPLIL